MTALERPTTSQAEGEHSVNRKFPALAASIVVPYSFLAMFESVAILPFPRLYVIGAVLSAVAAVLALPIVFGGFHALARWAQVELALIVAFVVMVLLSLLDAIRPVDHRNDVVSLVMAVLMSVVVAAAALQSQLSLRFLRKLMTASAVVGVLALVVAPDRLGWDGARLSALGHDPNELASYLAIVFTGYAYSLIYLSRSSSLNRTHAIVAIVTFGGILLTGSRGGLIGVVGAIVLIGPLSGRVSVRSLKNLALIATVVSSLLAGAYLYLDPATLPADSSAIGRFFDPDAQSSDDRAGGRVELYQLGIEASLRHPANGVGAGGYNPTDSREISFTAGPHNTFITAASQYGILAAVALTVLTLRVMLRLLRSSGFEQQFLGAGLLALVLCGLTVSLEGKKVTWLLLGFCVVAVAQIRQQGIRPDRSVG